MNVQTQLKEHGLSITPVRLAVLEALNAQPHTEAQKIFTAVQTKISTTSIQAIYNNLNALVACGMVREIKPQGLPSLFETRVNDNHHHLVCRHCGAVEDTNCLGAAPCLTPTKLQGFKIDEAEIIFWGLCRTCQNSQKHT